MVKRIVEPPKPYVYQYEPYPRWVNATDGNRKMVQNHEQEERETGVKMNPDGTVFVDFEPAPEPPTPPTLEIVMAAGYAKEVAEKIVEEEAAKARRGEKPYGDKEPEEPKFQTGGVPVGPVVEPAPEQFQLGAEAAALGTTPDDLKDLRQMASAGEPLVKPRGKKSVAPVQSGELAKEGGW